MSITGSQYQKTGCGKSHSAMKIGEIQDRDFSIKNVGFSPMEFLKGIDMMEQNTSQGTGMPRPGQVMVMDEGQIAAPNTAWYSITNKSIFFTLSTFRYLRGMAIIVTPSFYWIDKRVRALLSLWGTCRKTFNNNSPQVKMKVFSISTNMTGDELNFRKLMFWNSEIKRKVKLDELTIDRVSPQLEDDYEKKSKEWKKNERQKLMEEVADYERKFIQLEGRGDVIPDLDNVTTILFNNTEFMDNYRQRGKVSKNVMQAILVENDIHLSEPKLRQLRTMIDLTMKRKKDD